MDAIEQVRLRGPRSNILVLCAFYGVHPPATHKHSSQCEVLCPGSAAASAELSAAQRAVTWLAGEFNGALKHTAGSPQDACVAAGQGGWTCILISLG